MCGQVKASPPVKAPLKKRRVKEAGKAAEAVKGEDVGHSAAVPQGDSKAERPAAADAPKPASEKACENDAKAEEAQKANSAQALKVKRQQRAKLGLEKLAAALPDEEASLISLPGPSFDAMSWTAIHPAAVMTSKIGVILYAENFYVSKVECVPAILQDLFQAQL